MAAKIIRFPVDPRTKAQGTGRATEGGASLDLVIELADTDPALFRCATVRADDSLADLHALIADLFGWDGAHNYFFSHGSNRYEDPALFRSRDPLISRCLKLYSAADVPLGNVLDGTEAPLFYAYNLGNCWELRISVRKDVALEQFG